MILGVSDWLAPKLGMKPEHVRIGFLVAVLLAGAGVGLYLILWIIKTLKKE